MSRSRLQGVRLAEHVERLGAEHPPIDLASVDYTVRDPEAFSLRFGHVLDYMARVEPASSATCCGHRRRG